MTDFILGVIIVVIVGSAIVYIRKETKRGIKCIGCPDAPKCAQRERELASGCHCDSNGCSSCSGGCKYY